MFGKKNSSSEKIDSIIGPNTNFEGNVYSEGAIRIDGKLTGDIKINGDLYVGTNAIIKGNIYASNVHLSGTVEGNINASGVLKILSTAKLFGDIQVHSFVADEGGLFQGKCSMVDLPVTEAASERNTNKKGHPSKDYKKSTVIEQIEDKNGN